jgi:hypothetical protein
MAEKTPQSSSLNAEKSLALARALFPREKWVDAGKIRLKYKGEEFDIPVDINNIFVAQSRITRKKGDEKILAKERRQAHVLAEKGDCVYLIPKKKDAKGIFIPGPDAIVNGILFEFKNITGGLDRVEMRFRKSRKQCKNIFLKIDNPNLSKNDVIKKIQNVLKDPCYTGGTEGVLLYYITQTQRLYYIKTIELL